MAALGLVTLVSCDSPTSGSEIYDGDPETNESTPEEMEEKAAEERQDSTRD